VRPQCSSTAGGSPAPIHLMKGSFYRSLRSQLAEWRAAYYRAKPGFRAHGKLVPFVTENDGNLVLGDAILSGRPFVAARHGSTELACITDPRPEAFETLCGISGFFPRDHRWRNEFTRLYRDAAAEIDLLAAWNYRFGRFQEEERLFRLQGPNARTIRLNSLNPFLFEEPWSRHLEGKDVLVVHPFSASIRSQYDSRRERLFADPRVLPWFRSLVIVPAVQSMGCFGGEFETWFNALDHLKNRIAEHKFDIALIGCGCYGVPLAAHVKRLGRQAVHMGGALQLLFGIKGRRWEEPAYGYDQRFYNEYWMRPLPVDVPSQRHDFEGAPYW
jgi:hypothetical protein